MTHVELCPYTKYDSEICLMCDSGKNESCIRDMCVNCCSRQKIVQLVCPCSSQKIQETLTKRKEVLKGDENAVLCVRCYETPMEFAGSNNLNNKMCENCFRVQAIRGEGIESELSAYDREFLAMDPVHMARAMLCLVGDMHVKFRGELKRGRYDWFKPVCDSNIEESMTKANRVKIFSLNKIEFTGNCR
jgi:hypothetical protein